MLLSHRVEENSNYATLVLRTAAGSGKVAVKAAAATAVAAPATSAASPAAEAASAFRLAGQFARQQSNARHIWEAATVRQRCLWFCL